MRWYRWADRQMNDLWNLIAHSRYSWITYLVIGAATIVLLSVK